MGIKIQRKFYFLEVSGKYLVCVDSALSAPIDNPSGFSGRSSIPSSANCIELKPNTPTSSDSFCPNSGVLVTEKSYVDYDSASNTLLIKKVLADGNCGYSSSTVSVKLKSNTYTLYVRAIGVFPIIGVTYKFLSFGNDSASIIYPTNADFYYYVFSDLDGAVNWDLNKMVHSTSQIISPIAVSTSSAYRILPYLQKTNANINSKYDLKSYPPSATISYYQNDIEGESGFGRNDPDIGGADSQIYIQNSYDVQYGLNRYMLFNWEQGGTYPSYPRFILWPLAYDKLEDTTLYTRSISVYTLDLALMQNHTAKLLNQAVGVDSFPGIYDQNMYVNVEINAVQYYPLDASPKTSDNKYRLIFPDERFNYPGQNGFEWSRNYHLIPALYRNYASANGNPNNWLQVGIWNTAVGYGNPLSPSFNTIFGSYNFIDGRLWSVDQNCNLVYIARDPYTGLDDLTRAEGLERRIITGDLPNSFRSFSSVGTNEISIKIFPGVTPDTGGNAVKFVSLKYAVDIIYTVRISPDPISAGTPLTVNPPAVCPPSSLPVMVNNMPFIDTSSNGGISGSSGDSGGGGGVVDYL